MSNFYERLVGEAGKAVQEDYRPPERPACAHFVSEMMRKAGWKGKTTGWVPDFIDFGKHVKEPQAGDLVIFKQTYDAVSPAGIGPEDDKTHVGIVIGKSQFIHYSASADRPLVETFTDWWKNHVETYIRLPDPDPAKSPASQTNTIPTSTPQTPQGTKDDISTLKLFYHPATDRPKIIIDGKEDALDEMLLTARTKSGNEICITSHPFETAPYIRLNKQNAKVKSIEWTVKYEP